MPNAELQDELVWVLQPSQYAYIRQQNQLVEARYSLTARELKLVLYVCAMVDPNAETFGKCQIRVKEFAELAGVETDALYLELRDTARSVRSKELILENTVEPGEERPRRKYISWFIDVSVDPNGDGYIGVTLHPDLKPYLLQVHREYTRFQLGYAVRMESKYAIRLYQLLQRWAFVGKKRITVDDLRLRLGARELDKNGEIIKDNLPAYKNLKQKALTPAVDEINEKSDLSVSFSEEKQKGSKAITALNFRIRKNLETAGKFDEVKLPKKSQMELPLEQPGLSMEEQTQIDRISAEFALNAKQAEALADYVARDGIIYLLEKAEIVRSEPRQNAARAFIAALRDDWKKPVAIVDQQKAEKAKERQEVARREKAEAEAKQARESAEWEKNQSRIREYLETLSAPKRSELEIAALMASPLGRGQISLRVRQSIIDAYVLDILEGRSAHVRT